MGNRFEGTAHGCTPCWIEVCEVCDRSIGGGRENVIPPDIELIPSSLIARGFAGSRLRDRNRGAIAGPWPVLPPVSNVAIGILKIDAGCWIDRSASRGI